MGLFSKKKSKEELRQAMMMPPVPELPEFPDLPEESDSSEFPSYEPTIKDIKNEVGRDDDLEIPIRESKIQHSKPIENTAKSSPSRLSMDDEKPLFVQIDKYKDVLRSLEVLKAKVANAEDLLRGKQDVQSIKEKLLSMDEELFEV